MTDEAEKKYSKRGACYSCTECPYFGDKQQATRHWVTKHLPREEAPFSCNHCPRITFKVVEMKKHFDEKHPEFDMVTGVSGSKMQYTLKPTDAIVLSKEESLRIYSGKCGKAEGSAKGNSEVSHQPSNATEEIMSLLQQHPSLMEKVQDLVQLHKDVGNVPDPSARPVTPTTPTPLSDCPEAYSPSTTFSTPTSSPSTPCHLKKKVKSVVFKKPATPPNSPVSNPLQTKPFQWPTTLINSSHPPEQSSPAPELDIHPSETEVSDFLTTKSPISPLKSPKKKLDTKGRKTKKTNKGEIDGKNKTKDNRKKTSDEISREGKNEKDETKEVKRKKDRTATNEDTTTKNDTNDKREHKEKVTKKDRTPTRAIPRGNMDSPPPTKKQKTDKTGPETFDNKSHQNGNTDLTKQQNTTINESTQISLQTLVPLSAIGDIVENSIKNAVDSVASAIIVAARKQPLPPEQDLRPVTNQLMTTNANLAQIAGILSATNSKNSAQSVGLDELIKTASGLSAQLSRMTRSITVFTDVANKMDQHMVEQTNVIRSVVQGTIDAHAGLTAAMKDQAEAFRSLENRLNSALKVSPSSGHVSTIVKHILKIDDPETTKSSPSPSQSLTEPTQDQKDKSTNRGHTPRTATERKARQTDNRRSWTHRSQKVSPSSGHVSTIVKHIINDPETTKSAPSPSQSLTKPTQDQKDKSTSRGNTPRTATERKARQTDNRRSWTQRSQTPQYRRPFYRKPWERHSHLTKRQQTDRTGRKSPEKDARHRHGSREK